MGKNITSPVCLAFSLSLVFVFLSINSQVIAQKAESAKKDSSSRAPGIHYYLPDDPAFYPGGHAGKINTGVSQSRDLQIKKILQHTGSFQQVNSAGPPAGVTGPLNMTVVPTGSTCGYNNGSFQVLASGGTPPYSYSENGGAFQSGSLFSQLTAGTYQVVIKDASGQTLSSSVTVTNTYPLPSLYLVGFTVPSPCSGKNGTVTVAGSGGTPPYMYSDDGIHWQSSGIFTNLPSAKVEMIFLVRDANGCIQTYPFRFYSSHCSVITCQLYIGISECGKDGIISVYDVFGGTPPYTYSLDGIKYQSSPSFSDLTPGLYTVYVKDAAGTLLIFTCQLFSTCSLTMSVMETDATCGGKNGSILVTAQNGTAPYLYSLDGINFQLSAQFSGLAPGNYAVYVRDANSVIAATYNVIVNSACPSLALTETDATCGKNNGSITATGSGGVGPYTYSLDGINYQSDNIFTSKNPGTYTVYIKDAKGITSSTLITVNNDCLVVTATATNATCGVRDGNIMVSAANGTPPYSFSIDGINFQPSGTFNQVLAGNYQVIAKDALAVIGRDSVTVAVRNNIQVSAISTSASCADTGATLTITATGGGSPLEYSIDSGLNFNSANLFTALDTGLYWLVVQDPSGCRSSDSIRLSALPSPVVHLGPDTTLCEGQSILLTVTNPNATYLWNDGSTGSNLLVSVAGTYSVKVTENGCDTTARVAVNLATKPLIHLPKDTSVCPVQQLELNAAYPQSTYLWQDGSNQPVFTVTKPGTYFVQVTNACGLTLDTTNVISDNCACKFYVPNAFTPNNDGLNDIFLPRYQCDFATYELRIFNRWGQQVFKSESPSIGWDGTMGGLKQPVGVYVWQMSYKDAVSGKTTHQKGTLVLVR
jgi:gliding motility-associated-like protein